MVSTGGDNETETGTKRCRGKDQRHRSTNVRKPENCKFFTKRFVSSAQQNKITLNRQEKNKNMRSEEKRLVDVKEEVKSEDNKLKQVVKHFVKNTIENFLTKKEY